MFQEKDISNFSGGVEGGGGWKNKANPPKVLEIFLYHHFCAAGLERTLSHHFCAAGLERTLSHHFSAAGLERTKN